MAQRKCKNFITSYVQYTQNTEPSELYHTAVAMAIIAAVLKRNVFVDRGFYQLFPNLYTMLVGPTASGKTTAGLIGVGLLYKAIPDLSRTSGSQTVEDLVREMASIVHEDAEGKERVDALPRIIADGSKFVWAGEMASFFKDKDQRGMLTFLTDVYTCNDIPWEYKTKTRGKFTILNPCVNLLACTTPDWIGTSLPMDVTGGGFMGRIMFVCQRHKRGLIAWPSKPKDARRLEGDLIEDLQMISTLHGEMVVQDRARAYFEEWYCTRQPNKDMRMAGYEARKPEMVLKIAEILTIARGNVLVVTEEEIRIAIKWFEMIEKWMADAYMFLGSKEFSLAEQLIHILMDAGGKMVYRDAFDSMASYLTGHVQFSNIIEILRTRGLIEYFSLKLNSSEEEKWIQVLERSEIRAPGSPIITTENPGNEARTEE